MTTHLSDVELRAFAAGNTEADRLWRIDDHLAACEQCRSRAEQLASVPPAIELFEAQLDEPAEHLTDDEILLVVRQQLPADRADAVRQHLHSCEICARHVNDLRDWAEPPRVRVPSRTLAMAAAILLAAILIPAGVWYARSGRQADTTTDSAVARSLAGLETIDPQTQARVSAALTTGSATLPSVLADLRAQREVLLGTPGGADAFSLLTPVATVTVSDTPRFEWTPLAGADEYVVSIFDEQSRVIAQSATLNSTAWTPAGGLPRSVTLVWQVAAHAQGRTVTAPAAPAPPARFRVSDSESAAMLQQLERQYPQSHLLLGILYAEAGVLDRAKTHLQQVQPDDVNARVARETLRRLG